MEATDSRTSYWARRHSWIQVGMDFVSSKILAAGWSVAKNAANSAVNVANAVKNKVFGFWKGIENTSHKTYDESEPQSKQGDEEHTDMALSIPEGETIDPEILNTQNYDEDAESDISQSRNSSSMTLKKPMFWNLLAGTSPQVKYMAILMLRASQAKSEMDRCLEEILKINERNDVLSKQAKDESQKAANIKKDASEKECSANKWGAWGQCISTLGTALGPIGATVGTVVSAGVTTYSAYRKSQAAVDTCDSEKTQAEAQLIRDKQGINSTEINTMQSVFSMASQEYNMTLSMLQAVIASENEAKRTTAANIR